MIKFTFSIMAQMSAYSTHTNLAVHKSMKVMRTAYAKSGVQSQHILNYTRQTIMEGMPEYCERKASIVSKQHFSNLLNLLMVAKVLVLRQCWMYIMYAMWYSVLQLTFVPTARDDPPHITFESHDIIIWPALGAEICALILQVEVKPSCENTTRHAHVYIKGTSVHVEVSTSW